MVAWRSEGVDRVQPGAGGRGEMEGPAQATASRRADLAHDGGAL